MLNHLCQREKRRKERKIYAAFVNLSAAFDNVNREKLWEILERKGVKGNVIKRLKKIYKETRSTIRTGEVFASR